MWCDGICDEDEVEVTPSKNRKRLSPPTSKRAEKESELLTLQYSTSPQVYGLPKVHKEHVPLTIGSPTYLLARELARIISPLSGQTQSFIKNSADFVKKIEQVSLDKHDYMARL